MGPLEDPTRTREVWSRLCAELRRRGLDEHAAEDLTQETWLRALRKPPAEDVPLAPWLFGVARRVRLERARGDRHRRERESRAARPEHVAPGEVDEAVVPPVLADLRAPYGQVLAWRFLDELEIAEIARRTGRSEATVRSQLSRGLELLRERLEPRRRRWLGAWIPTFLRRPRAAWALAGLVLLAVPVRLAWRGERPARADAAAARPAVVPRPADPATLAAPASPSTPTARAPLALTPTTLALAVRALDPRGRSVAGAVVRSAPDLQGKTRLEGTCDAEGRLALAAIEAERWLWAEAPGLWSSPRVLIASASGLGGPLELPLRRAPRLTTLRVVDAEGAPVPHARVTVDSFVDLTPPILVGAGGTLEVAPDEREFLADATGSVTIPWPVRDRFRVRAEGAGSVSVRDWSAEEAAAARELRLDPGVTVRGQTLAPDGAPLTGARVEAFQRRPGLVRTATSDAEGRFTLGGLAPGPLELVAGDGATRGARLEVVLGAPEERVAPLVLLEGQALHGTLRAPDGGGLAGRRVAHVGPGEPGAERGAERWTTTDDQGRFAFGGLPAGERQQLLVLGPAGAFPPAARLEGLFAGRAALALEVAGDERPRTPLVLLFEGTPAPHAVALRTGEATCLVLPETPGRFLTPPLPEGDYEVVALARTDDGQLLGPWLAGTLHHEVSAPTEHPLAVPPSGTLWIRAAPTDALRAVHVVLPAFAAPVPGGDWSVQRRVVLSPGATEASCALVAGDHDLAVVGGAAERHERVRVAAGGTTVLALEEAGGLLVRLRLDARRPLDGDSDLRLVVRTPTGARELALGSRGRAVDDGLECTVVLPEDSTAVEVLTPDLAGHASLDGPVVLSGPARLIEIPLAPR